MTYKMIFQKMIPVNMFLQKYTFPRELTSEQHIFSRVNLCMYYYYGYKKSSKPSLFDKECLLLFVASDWLASPEDLTCRSRLLSVVLVRYCQLLAAMCAARSQYATTILFIVLVGFICWYSRFWVAKLLIIFEISKDRCVFSLNIYVFFRLWRNIEPL